MYHVRNHALILTPRVIVNIIFPGLRISCLLLIHYEPEVQHLPYKFHIFHGSLIFHNFSTFSVQSDHYPHNLNCMCFLTLFDCR